MTTKVTIDANAGHPVRVTPIGSGTLPHTVEPGDRHDFVVFRGQDLLVQELPRDGAAVTADTDEPILRFFAFAHLPAHLQGASAPFAQLANALVLTLPRNPERTVALRKLLEVKDAAVRAGLG